MFSFNSDPLQEEKYTIIPGLIHKYENRILVELNLSCPVVCEFCTRKRKGISKNNFNLSMEDWNKIENYIKSNTEIREIILSGGDPLIKSKILITILERLKMIDQIKIIRIHTRMPITAPKKIDEKIFDYFSRESKNRVFYISIHCDHKNELTDEGRECVKKLRQTGVILYSQSVLLKNYNDTVKDLKQLYESLLELGIRPYYLYQCDKIDGWQKFRVPFWKEIWLVKKLNKQISGLACPIFVVDSSKYKKRFY